MIKLCIWIIYHKIARFSYLQAEINVIKRYPVIFIQSFYLIIYTFSNHKTCRCHCG